MLREDPQPRPNIYQVVREGCLMQGREVPIKDVCWSSYCPHALSWTNPRLLHRYTRTQHNRNREPGRSLPRTRAHQTPRRSWVPSSRRIDPRSKPSQTWCPCEGADSPRLRQLRSNINRNRPRHPSGSAATRSLPWILARPVGRRTSSPLGSPHSTSSTFSTTKAANSTLTLPLLARARRRPRSPATVCRSSWQARPLWFWRVTPRRPRSANERYPAPRRHRPRPRRRLPPRASRDRSPRPPRHGRPR